MARKPRNQRVQVPRGLPYGSGERLAQAQRDMPIPNGPGGAVPSPPAGRVGGPPPPAPPGGGGSVDMAAALAAAATTAPPSGGSLTSPTGRPGEPLTTGLPIGPGGGPMTMGLPAIPEDDAALATLIAIYQRAPNESVRRLVEAARARAMARARTLDEGRTAMRPRPGSGRPL